MSLKYPIGRGGFEVDLYGRIRGFPTAAGRGP